MRRFTQGCVSRLLLLALIFPAAPQDAAISGARALTPDGGAPTATPPVAPGSFDEVIDRVVERKRVLLAQCATCGPTHLQNLKPDASGDPAPVNDRYLSDASI